MIFPAFPIIAVDLLGSMLMIVFSLLCFERMMKLTKIEGENILWTYLLFVCAALSIFAISRSVGHIVKQLLFMFDYGTFWSYIRPFSGSVNTLAFILVASVTVFFERVWVINRAIIRDRMALREAHQELSFLNQNLEKLVSERTAALSLTEKRYRRIFELSGDMIVLTTKEGQILAMNPAAMVQLEGGHTLGPGARFEALFAHDAQYRFTMESLSETRRMGNTEVIFNGAGGKPFRALLSGVADLGSDEENILFMIRDVEETLAMREQMATTEKLAAVGELSAGVAHEVNNPLGIILGYTQLLKRNAGEDEAMKEDLSIIEKHVIGCKKVVESLLNFSRMKPPEKISCDVRHIVDEVVTFSRHQASMDGIEVITRFDESGIPSIYADPEKMKQVLLNLILNAVHAIDGEGRIHITAGMDGAGVFITVADTGCGMDNETRSRIFDPFFTTKPTGTGTGLGLSVSYGIIKNHGGDIEVVSTPGEGTAFTIHIPTSE